MDLQKIETPKFEKRINSFTGELLFCKCTKCGMVANFDLEEFNHKCGEQITVCQR